MICEYFFLQPSTVFHAMGEAALAREFKKAPPREPLTSITALWRD